MSSSDQNRNLVAAMAYLLFFVTGIVILMVEQEDKFVRFHAMQSTLVFGGLFILNLVFQIGLDPIAIIGFLFLTFSSCEKQEEEEDISDLKTMVQAPKDQSSSLPKRS